MEAIKTVVHYLLGSKDINVTVVTSASVLDSRILSQGRCSVVEHQVVCSTQGGRHA
jgi:hypothetical protein